MASAILDFCPQKVFTQSLEIDDIGNFALKCLDPNFLEYYICVQTVAGKAYILKFGPLLPDLDAITEDFYLSSKVIDYKEQKIEKDITIYINEPKKNITQIELVKTEEVLQNIPTAERFIPV